MNKVIWTYLAEGRDAASPHLDSCLQSWESKNPGWKFRCLDAATADRYLPIKHYIDLTYKAVSPDSLSQILRLLLLHEFGGVWVDPDLLCVQPLDEWLPAMMQTAQEGFLAFASGTSDQVPSISFLAAEEYSPVITRACRGMVAHWKDRDEVDAAWLAPLLKKDGFPPSNPDWVGELKSALESKLNSTAKASRPSPKCASFASLKVSTENIGDHIQIIAGLRILARLGIKPIHYIDRDHEIHSAPQLARVEGPVGILLNGWFKSNRAEWPPHPKLVPLLIGFHIRAFQCPELLLGPSLEFFRRHGPIGCRDVHTHRLLQERGVDSFVSDCLTLTLNRRIEDPATQTETFVVSRDREIESHLPTNVGPYTYITHYSGTHDFVQNLQLAKTMLEAYQSRAKLIVTTLLHCALPAIAMGIPVIVLYPANDEKGHQSDRERFSSLENLVPIYSLEEMAQVNWEPHQVPISQVKLNIFDRFYELAAAWC